MKKKWRFSMSAVSPDGRLLQASTEADVGSFAFAGGHVADVPRSYIEFAERLVLPEFEHLPKDEVRSSGSLRLTVSGRVLDTVFPYSLQEVLDVARLPGFTLSLPLSSGHRSNGKRRSLLKGELLDFPF
jgi:hypothetical protein